MSTPADLPSRRSLASSQFAAALSTFSASKMRRQTSSEIAANKSASAMAPLKAGKPVTIVTMGPERAAETVRKALSMGADAGVHVVDAGLHGSDALATSYALASVLEGRGLARGLTRFDPAPLALASGDLRAQIALTLGRCAHIV